MVNLTNHTCPAINTYNTDQDAFFDGHWDAHKVGWLISGATAAVATVISLISFILHARNYYRPKEQRQILRIILMPAVYAVISFFSYRYFRTYTYYQLALICYEALVLAAFLMLLLQYIGDSTAEQRKVLLSKDKTKIPIPFCCIRYRPSKPYFLHALKWSVLQYCFLRPLISLAGVITNALGLLCPTQYSIYFAEVYLDSFDFVSISVALYGLIVFYALVKERLAGKQPLAKFLSIKGIVIVTFYQGFVFSILQDYGVIKGTQYWTATNVADGLQALATCCEMVIFAAVFLWSFSYKSYREMRPAGAPHTNPFWAFLDSINYSDFIMEGWRGIVFTVRYILGRPGTHSGEVKGPLNIDDAFNRPTSDGHSEESEMQYRPSDVEAPLATYNNNSGTKSSYGQSSIPRQAFGRTSNEEYSRGQQQDYGRGQNVQGYEEEYASDGDQRGAYQGHPYSNSNSNSSHQGYAPQSNNYQQQTYQDGYAPQQGQYYGEAR